MIFILKKINFTTIKVVFFEDVDIDNVLIAAKILFSEKTINTLLVSFMMIKNLRHCMRYFQKRVRM